MYAYFVEELQLTGQKSEQLWEALASECGQRELQWSELLTSPKSERRLGRGERPFSALSERRIRARGVSLKSELSVVLFERRADDIKAPSRLLR